MSMRPDQIIRHWPSGIGTTSSSPTGQIAICIGTKIEILVHLQSHLPNSQTPQWNHDDSKPDYNLDDFDIKVGSTSKYPKVRRP